MSNHVVLTTYQSSSNPGKHYEIRLGGDGVIYCTCAAWKFQGRHCKHIDMYEAGRSMQVETGDSIDNAIKEAIKIMKG